MNITNLFGEHLAKLTERKPMVCKGMIRLAVLDKFPGKKPEQLNYNDLKDVFSTSLKERLDNVNSHNVDKISEDMILYLVRNQSLMTMA